MEVHTHTHTARKKWTHYFWEFLMLFLAVFCGFLAELQLEHKIERDREKQYIRSMIEDVKTDTVNLSVMNRSFNQIESELEFVLGGFDNGIKDGTGPWRDKFVLSFRSGFPDFYHADRTIQQLKNSGGMRLIRNKNTAIGIVNYDAILKDLDFELANLTNTQIKYIDEVMKSWSMKKMLQEDKNYFFSKDSQPTVKRNYWLTEDLVAIEQVFNRLLQYYEAISQTNAYFSIVKAKAVALIEMLKKEYHME
jgi:hypothetical protein